MTDTAVQPRETIEIWKPIPGFSPHYEASTHGRIRRSAKGPHTATGRVLSPSPDSYDYMTVCLCCDGVRTLRPVHVLVMLAFVGPCPDGCTVNHIDAIKSHNWLSNLEYMTRGENIRQAFKDGLYPSREGMAGAKLNEAQVAEIKTLIGLMPNTRIAAKFGVSEMAIRKIRDGKTWRGLPSTPAQGGQG